MPPPYQVVHNEPNKQSRNCHVDARRAHGNRNSPKVKTIVPLPIHPLSPFNNVSTTAPSPGDLETDPTILPKVEYRICRLCHYHRLVLQLYVHFPQFRRSAGDTGATELTSSIFHC